MSPRALKWVPCAGCGAPTRPKTGPLCSTCRTDGPPAPVDTTTVIEVKAPAARRRRIDSGWCQSGLHGRCCHLLQTATDKRPEIHCGCRCHRLVRNMSWAQAR